LLVAGLIAIGVIALVVGLVGLPQAPAESSNQTEEATVGDVTLTVDASGQIVDEFTYSIAPGADPVVSAIAGVDTGAMATAESGYTTTSIEVALGGTVAAGDTLAYVDDFDGDNVAVSSNLAGRVRSITAIVGAPAGQIATLGLGRVLLAVQVSEYDVNALQPGQTVTVSIPALDDEVDGLVSTVSQTSSDESGVEEYQVLIEFAELPAAIRIGMTATASIVVDSVTDVVTVSPSAITQIGDQSLVTVQNADGSTSNQPVTVGLVGTSRVEIVEGLEAGDVVVVGVSGEVPVVESGTGPGSFG
jgi:HlyD family secretion protein